MLKLGVAFADKELALKITKHLTKDEMFDITNLSEQCDLMLIDKNIIKNPRGFFPLKKPSDKGGYESLLHRLGFNYSNGTYYLAEIIYEYSLNPSKLILKDYYNKLAIKYSIQPDEVKWSVINTFRIFKSNTRLPKGVNNLKEYVDWIINY